MIITIEHETDTAHRLSCHKGKCANLHGHRYKFVVSVEVQGTIEQEGFIDFYDLKKVIKNKLDNLLDHAVMLKECEENKQLIDVLEKMSCKVLLMDFEPTVEAMTRLLSVVIANIPEIKNRLSQLTIYETPTNYCTWEKGE